MEATMSVEEAAGLLNEALGAAGAQHRVVYGMALQVLCHFAAIGAKGEGTEGTDDQRGEGTEGTERTKGTGEEDKLEQENARLEQVIRERQEESARMAKRLQQDEKAFEEFYVPAADGHGRARTGTDESEEEKNASWQRVIRERHLAAAREEGRATKPCKTAREIDEALGCEVVP